MQNSTLTKVAVVAVSLLFFSELSKAGTTANNLREGLEVAFHNLETGAQKDHQFLEAKDEKIILAGDRSVPGTKWIVHQTASPGEFTFENREPGSRLFLDGLTLTCDVGLAPNTGPPFTGTAWKVSDLPNPDFGGFDHVTLQTKGAAQGSPCPFPHSFLIGNSQGFGTLEGHVGLAADRDTVTVTHGRLPNSGTHWELILWDSPRESGGENPCLHPSPGVHCPQ
jgi:hypothetical protein